MIEDLHIQETAHVLQTTILDILRRRAIMEGLEYRALEKKVPYELSLRIYGSDYLRSQLSDLRKFFDGREDVYRTTDLTTLADPAVKETHEALRDRWRAQFGDLANKYFFHREPGYLPSDGFPGQTLDMFIDDLDIFLNKLVESLTRAGYKVGYIPRDKEHLQILKADAVKFYSRLGD